MHEGSLSLGGSLFVSDLGGYPMGKRASLLAESHSIGGMTMEG